MNEPNRTQWQIRCAFNGFCKQALKREAMNAHRDTKRQQSREVTFSDLSPLEESQLVTYDRYFADDEAEQSFIIAGKEITAKLLAEALRSLPEEKRETILLYYFFDMSETEISRLCETLGFSPMTKNICFLLFCAKKEQPILIALVNKISFRSLLHKYLYLSFKISCMIILL